MPNVLKISLRLEMTRSVIIFADKIQGISHAEKCDKAKPSGGRDGKPRV